MFDFTDIFHTAIGIPVADTAFKTEQRLPFAVYIDDSENDGDDFHSHVIRHDLTVEFYSEHIDKGLEQKFEKCFDSYAWKYKKARIYLKEERMYETIYMIKEFMERKESV